MSGAVRLVIAAVAGAALAAGSAAISRVPVHGTADRGARLRLSWTARGERIERCRRLTDQELANVPVHMRQQEICDGAAAPYRLLVGLDGVAAATDTVIGAGARHDRPLSVYREIVVEPGPRRVTVRFERLADSTTSPTPPDSARAQAARGAPPEVGRSARAPGDSEEAGAGRERQGGERDKGRRAIIPPRLSLDSVVNFGEREVVLATYDPAARRLVLVRAAAAAPRPP